MENWRPAACEACPNCVDCRQKLKAFLPDRSWIYDELFTIAAPPDKSVEAFYMGFYRIHHVEFLPLTIYEKFPNLVLYAVRYCSVKKIRRENLAGLKELKFLLLDHNRIHVIEEKSFDDLVNLEVLDLGQNLIASLPSLIFNNLQSLEKIYLRNNRMENLQGEIFETNLRLEENYLNDNRLEKINSKSFDGLKWLKVIDLSENKCISAMIGNSEKFRVLSVEEKLKLKQELDRKCNF